MKKLIIAEKPSVAKNIADATGASRKNGYFEGASYVITWAFGHLLQLYDAVDYDPSMKTWKMDRFPFIPEHFQYKLKTAQGSRDKADAGVVRQMNIIRDLMERSDVEGIISATDDDREGQIIADEIINYIGPSKPVERILLNEWTSEEVNRGLSALRPNEEMKSLQDAGFGRQIADWLIGINLTSVATLKNRHPGEKSRLLNIGRVIMPTLKIIYDRDQEIRNFKVTSYYKLKGIFSTQNKESFEGFYVKGKKEKFETPEEIEELTALRDKLEGRQARITDKSVKQKKEPAPSLFNLSGLQGHVTGKYKGWTSDKVLKTAQQLYEKKLITYPRTASSVLDESLIDKTAKVLAIHRKGHPYEDKIRFHKSKRVFDSRKVESHSAIIPTYVIPGDLSQGEKIVYDTIRNRFLAQFMPFAVSEDTVLRLKVTGEPEIPGEFTARGKIQLEPGWKLVEGVDSKETLLPAVEKDDIVDIKKAELTKVDRKPPKPHTEKTLLKVMETCGRKYEEKDAEEMMMAILSGFSIGTPATRAETIKKLKTAGYIKAKGKSLSCTDLGCYLVEHFPARELFDLEYTGRLEKTLSDIERKKFSKSDFLKMIESFVRDSVEKIKEDEGFGDSSPALHREPAGKCPECGGDIMEHDKFFGCSNWKEKNCKYAIWKNSPLMNAIGKEVSYDLVKVLLEYGKVGLKDCVSKKKKTRFDAIAYYEKNEETGRYDWRLQFINNRRNRT